MMTSAVSTVAVVVVAVACCYFAYRLPDERYACYLRVDCFVLVRSVVVVVDEVSVDDQHV